MRYSRLILNIVITGTMLGLVLLMQYLEEFTKFKEVGITINMSLIFIIMTYHLTGKWQYTFLVILLKFAIGPAMNGGYTPVNLWGHSFNIIAFSTGVLIYIPMMRFFLKKNTFTISFTLAAIASILAITLMMIVWTWFVGVPVYFYLLDSTGIMPTGIKSVSLSDSIHFYEEKGKALYYFIPNYWGGIAVKNFVGNVVKDLLNFIVLFALLKGIVNAPHIELFHARSKVKVQKVQNA